MRRYGTFAGDDPQRTRATLTMGIRSVTTYPFETQWLIGEIRCHEVHKPGVIYADQTRDWNFSVEFRYTPGPDWIDFEMRLQPNTSHRDFDFFFASYLIEDMESTWVPASIDGREEWRKLDNRRSEPWGNMYHVPRDDAYRQLLYDGRYRDAEDNPGVADFHYSRPILVCHKQASGLACVTLIEPGRSRTLCGQKHRYETAHDFTFSGDLVAGHPFTGRARLVVRNIGPFPDAVGEIDAMWSEFESTL